MVPQAWLNFFCVILMAILAIGIYRRRTGRRSNKLFFALVVAHGITLFCDGIYWCMDGRAGFVPMAIVFVLIYAFCLLMLTLYHYYLRAFWKEHYGIGEDKKFKYFPIVVNVVFNILWISSFFTHLFFVMNGDGSYYYTRYHIFSQLGILLILLPDLIVLLKEREKMGFKNCLLWVFLPTWAVVIRILDLRYKLPFVYPAIALCIVGIYTIVNTEMDTSIDKHLLAVRASMGKVMISQIQPHFLYNVLNSISILCHKNPDRAAEITDEFAQYLRWNINSVFSSEPVSVSEEINHTKKYLELEKERFGDILEVKWNIKDDSFYIPPLVLQPLVENAVRHGICQKEDGGTIWIDIYSDEYNYNIVITDNGNGFDSSKQKENEDKLHVGLSYAREQVEGICGGTLDTESTPGRGTRVRITLPRENNTYFSLSYKKEKTDSN
ncbi:MAG: histidine kinase [Spirochaetales bacterium]|nr:histidine kinase [Spirochaetales bacterium]